MFHITGFTNLLILLSTFANLAHRITTETSVVTHNNADPGCSLNCLPGEIIGCVNFKPELEVNTYTLYKEIQTECLILYQNVTKLFACKNNKWIAFTDTLNAGEEINSVLHRRPKRFLFDNTPYGAETTNYCHCSLGEWQPWSACTVSCSSGNGGTHTRRRALYHDSRSECFSEHACPDSHHVVEVTICNARCENGAGMVFIGEPDGIIINHQLLCPCPRGTIGECCQAISCGTPSAISHGRISGSLYTYDNTIEYSCDSGYRLNYPWLSIRVCTESGIWSGQLPSCEYDVCSSGTCKNGAVCFRRNGGYSCSCSQFWTGKNCEVDIQPPVVYGCPANRFIHVSNKTSMQSWNVPIFHDPRGNHVIVTKNYPVSSYEFPWGVYTIQYTAVKPSNGLSAECTFQITIHPRPCPKLPVPSHGLTACNGWQTDYAKVCKVYCLEGYSLPPLYKPNLIFSCGSSGSWRPAIQVQECVQAGTFVTKKMPTFRECSLSNDDVRLQYITDLKHSQFNSLCLKNENECTKNNVTISCT